MAVFSNDKIFIIAGEVSGDMLAAELMRAINKKRPTQFIGIGGSKMREQGLNPVAKDNSLLSAIGLFEAKSFLIKQALLLKKIIPSIKKNNIKEVILVDHEVFCLLVAKLLRHHFNNDIIIHYFIPPRVSMWGARNAQKIAELCDTLFCYMEPDQKIYSKYTDKAFYFGHPLSKRLKNYVSDPLFFEKHSLDPKKEYITLMPGSRKQEIKSLLPIFLKTAERLHHDFGIEFLMAVAHEGLKKKVLELINKSSIGHAIHIIRDSGLEIMSHTNIGIVSAGTITIEAVMMKMYPLISYKISNITFNTLRKKENLPDNTLIGLPNVLLQERIFPEILQHEVNPERLYQEIAIIRNFTPEALEYFMHQVSGDLGKSLGSTECYNHIAEYIINGTERG